MIDDDYSFTGDYCTSNDITLISSEETSETFYSEESAYSSSSSGTDNILSEEIASKINEALYDHEYTCKINLVENKILIILDPDLVVGRDYRFSF